MAQIDVTISQAQYDAMMVVFDGVRAKGGTLKAALTLALSQEDGQAKVKAFVAGNEDARWLREVNQFRKDLDGFFEAIGWRDR